MWPTFHIPKHSCCVLWFSPGFFLATVQCSGFTRVETELKHIQRNEYSWSHNLFLTKICGCEPTVPGGPLSFLTGTNSTPPCHRHFTEVNLSKTHPNSSRLAMTFQCGWDSWNCISCQTLCLPLCMAVYLFVGFLSNMKADAMTNLFTDVIYHDAWHKKKNEPNKCLLNKLMLKWWNCPIYPVSTDCRNHLTHLLLNPKFIKYLPCAKNYVRSRVTKKTRTLPSAHKDLQVGKKRCGSE